MPRLLILSVAVLAAAACSAPAPLSSPPVPGTGAALFYAKGGAIYVSDPAGAPGRKLTSGPHDTQPAPSPYGTRVAFIRQPDPAEPGGELWVLDVSSGEARRLIDPADLAPDFDGDLRQVDSPQWSPTGDRIAFLRSSYGGGGFLMTADPGTGTVLAPPEPLFADPYYGWAPDGSRIAWVGGRSDVSPVDVNILTVGEASVPVAEGTNAFAVAYARDGRGIVFTNADATGEPFTDIPFRLREGGIYVVDPPGGPAALLAGTGSYADVAALPSGALAFTEWSADQTKRTIAVLDRGAESPRTLAETPGDAAAPAWSGAETVAYIGTAEDRPLLVKRADGDAIEVDAGVDAFAWAGQAGG